MIITSIEPIPPASTAQNNVINPNNVFQLTMAQLFEALGEMAQPLDRKDHAAAIIPAVFDEVDFIPATKSIYENGQRIGSVPKIIDGKAAIKRCAANTRFFTMVAADFDDGTSIDEARQRFDGYSYILYSSFNHLADGYSHKFRILFETLLDIEPREMEYRKAAIQKFLGSVDPSTTDTSRLFYVPTRNTKSRVPLVLERSIGEPLDLHSFERIVPKIVERNISQAYSPNGGSSAEIGSDQKNEILDLISKCTLGSRSEWLAVITAMKACGYTESECQQASAGNPLHASPTTGIKDSSMVSAAYASTATWESGLGVITNALRRGGFPEFRFKNEARKNDLKKLLLQRLKNHEKNPI